MDESIVTLCLVVAVAVLILFEPKIIDRFPVFGAKISAGEINHIKIRLAAAITGIIAAVLLAIIVLPNNTSVAPKELQSAQVVKKDSSQLMPSTDQAPSGTKKDRETRWLEGVWGWRGDCTIRTKIQRINNTLQVTGPNGDISRLSIIDETPLKIFTEQELYSLKYSQNDVNTEVVNVDPDEDGLDNYWIKRCH